MSYFRVENLFLYFGGLKVVDFVSFVVEKGEIFLIIGSNGVGKSSIFNLILCIYLLILGKIFFEDQDIINQPAYEIAGFGIVRIFQNIELFENATMLSNLLVGCYRYFIMQLWQELLFLLSVRVGEKVYCRCVEQVIEFFDLEVYCDKLIFGFSYGVRKVIELARALCFELKLILFDEPLFGFNVEEIDDMLFWICDMKIELGIIVLMVEYDMMLVNCVFDCVIAFNYGCVFAMGLLVEVQCYFDVVAVYFGV